jgi:hypothetical protein
VASSYFADVAGLSMQEYGRLKYVRPVFLAILLLTYAWVRIGFRDIPLERDEGAYVYMGGVLLDGGVPYIDLLEPKPPGLFYTYALLYAISGGDLAWMHVWMALLVTGSALLLHALACRWMGQGAAMVSVAAFVGLSMSLQASGFSIQSEHIVVFFSLAGLLVLDRSLEKGSWSGLVLAGMLLCWSVITKLNGVFFALFGTVYALFAHPAREGGRVKMLGRLPLLGGGALVVLAAWAHIWLWADLATDYVARMTWADAMSLLPRRMEVMLRDAPVWWALACLGMPAIMVGPLMQRQRVALGLFVVASLLTVVPGWRFFGHYFLMLFPALALCVGQLANVIAHWMGARIEQGRALPVHLIFAIGVFVVDLCMQRMKYFEPDHTAVLRYVYTSNPFPEARMVADLINSRKRPGDGVFVMGFEPQIYLYTDTRSPTRWLNTNALMYVHPLADSVRSEVRHALAANPPRFVVWSQHFTSWMPPPRSDQSFLESYWNELHRDYRVIAWFEQDPTFNLTVVIGDEASSYTPKGDRYIFLAERKDGADT